MLLNAQMFRDPYLIWKGGKNIIISQHTLKLQKCWLMLRQLNLVIPVRTSEYGKGRKTKKPPFLQISHLFTTEPVMNFLSLST